MKIILIPLLALFCATVARSEDALLTPDSLPDTAADTVADTSLHAPQALVAIPPAPQSGPAKDMGTAYVLAVGGTFVPLVMLSGVESFEGVMIAATAFAIGPSAGQFYAGSPATGMAGVLIRVVGGAAVTYSVADCLGAMFSDEGCAEGLAYIGGGLLVFGLFYSLIDTKGAVDRANGSERVSLSPALLPVSEGRDVMSFPSRWAPGLAFNVTF